MIRIMIIDRLALMRHALREIIHSEEDLQVVAETDDGNAGIALAEKTRPNVIVMDLDLPQCDGFAVMSHLLQQVPQIRIIVFPAFHDDLHILQAFRWGASGYITKDAEPASLIHMIRCTARNDLWLPAPLAASVVDYLRQSQQVAQTHLCSHLPPTQVRQRELHQSSLINETASYQRSLPDTQPLLEDTSLQVALYSPTTGVLPTPDQHSLRPLTEREREILFLMRKGRKNREIAAELFIAPSTVHKHVQHIFAKLRARNRAEAIYLSTCFD